MRLLERLNHYNVYTHFWYEYNAEVYHLQDECVDGKVLLKCILKDNNNRVI
jgi:hypothetical protein